MSDIVEIPKKIVKGAMSFLGFETPKVPDTVINMPAPTPEQAPQPKMPLPDDAQARAAKRKSIAEQRKRRGRASTMLSTNDDALGG